MRDLLPGAESLEGAANLIVGGPLGVYLRGGEENGVHKLRVGVSNYVEAERGEQDAQSTGHPG